MKNTSFIFILFYFVCTSVCSSQNTYDWRSSAVDGVWSNNQNWTLSGGGGGFTQPGGNDIIQIQNNAQLSMTYDLGTNRYRIRFGSGSSSSRVITGTTQASFVTVGGQNPRIENNSTAIHTLNFPIRLGNRLLELRATDGGLTFGGNINTNGFDINIYGAKEKEVTFNGIISGSGSFEIKQNSIVEFLNDNTYTGDTVLDSGTLKLSGNLANSNITVNNFATLQISDDVTISSLTVNTGGTVVIDSGKSLVITNNFSNVGTSFTVNSGASLMVGGTSSGNILYTRDLETSNWYLISSPVVGQDIDDFVAASSLQAGSTNTNLRALGTYNTIDDTWSYYVNGSSSADSFESGIGRSVNLDASSGSISFTGTVLTNDLTPINLVTAGNGFNLLGNPYPSYIAADNIANATSNLLAINASQLVEQTIWMWNQETNSYDQFNHTSGLQVAPGQAFFVRATGSSPTFSITELMQSHQSTDTFQRSTSSTPKISLMMNNGADVSDTDIFYIEGTTTGFDNGYDSSIFNGASNPFMVYTQVVADGDGRNLGIQSLPPDNYENMIVPIGINAVSGTEITVSAIATNLPTDIKVYLEDKDNNTFTLLDSSSDFTTMLVSDLNGVGRFYLHTTSNPLSINNNHADNISMYLSSNDNLRIVGVHHGSGQVNIHNILGKKVVNTSFQGNGLNDILLPNLKTGIYIVQLETETGQLNKKVIIEY